MTLRDDLRDFDLRDLDLQHAVHERWPEIPWLVPKPPKSPRQHEKYLRLKKYPARRGRNDDTADLE